MKPVFAIEVLERMGQIVVHVRQEFGPDEHVDTLVLEEHTATELCVRLLAALKKRRAGVATEAKPTPERWWQFRARACERRGPREAYGLGRTEDEAQRNSAFARMHPGELTAIQMPEDFVPPNGATK